MAGEAIIAGVVPGSIAAEAGLKPGDCLLSINGQAIADLIDYKYLMSDCELRLQVLAGDGEEWEIDVEKGYDEDLGLEFSSPTFDRMRSCANDCIFCFIKQNPAHLRPTLYEYDDDYRLSFLCGNYVTLTNLRPADWERIVRLRLSPLFVSVHAMDPSVRERLLGTPRARPIRQHLDLLRANRIVVHAQVVLVPEINDGEQLAYTVTELAKYHPSVQSVALVPVGLTRYRDHLPVLRPFTHAEALELAVRTGGWQKAFRRSLGTRFVWLADELYLTHDLRLPERHEYEDLPQIENGVGLVARFTEELESAWEELVDQRVKRRPLSIATGVMGAKVLQPVVGALGQRGAQVQLVTVHNRYFGESITAAGLLTGQDLIAALSGQDLGQELLIPEVMVRAGQPEPVFLDDVSVSELEKAVGVPVTVVAGPRQLLRHFIE
jgi:putative radical SAM enzyme (TIGR03279 family)